VHTDTSSDSRVGLKVFHDFNAIRNTTIHFAITVLSLSSVMMAWSALSNPETTISIQKRHPYTGNLNSETSGDSKNTSLLCGNVIELGTAATTSCGIMKQTPAGKMKQELWSSSYWLSIVAGFGMY